MLMVIGLSLLSVLCFALSQHKHFAAVFKRSLQQFHTRLLRSCALLLLLLIQYLLWQQPKIGLSYVIWLCWVSIWIVVIGFLLSDVKKSRAR